MSRVVNPAHRCADESHPRFLAALAAIPRANLQAARAALAVADGFPASNPGGYWMYQASDEEVVCATLHLYSQSGTDGWRGRGANLVDYVQSRGWLGSGGTSGGGGGDSTPASGQLAELTAWVKANPLPAAVAGGLLAWLVFGRR